MQTEQQLIHRTSKCPESHAIAIDPSIMMECWPTCARTQNIKNNSHVDTSSWFSKEIIIALFFIHNILQGARYFHWKLKNTEGSERRKRQCHSASVKGVGMVILSILLLQIKICFLYYIIIPTQLSSTEHVHLWHPAGGVSIPGIFYKFYFHNLWSRRG